MIFRDDGTTGKRFTGAMILTGRLLSNNNLK